MKPINQILITLLLSFSSLAFAQDDIVQKPIVTDRPDATEASSTVGKGILQIETGGIYETDKQNAVKVENYTYNYGHGVR